MPPTRSDTSGSVDGQRVDRVVIQSQRSSGKSVAPSSPGGAEDGHPVEAGVVVRASQAEQMDALIGNVFSVAPKLWEITLAMCG